MKTEILPAHQPGEIAATLPRVLEALRAGEIVALPTETVYGLAADALNPNAVAKIFEAKERPRFDPLIVHLPGEKWIDRIARIDLEARPLLQKLIGAFWPGPLTFVLPRRETIPDIVTAGLETVAVRMCAHAIFAEVVRSFDRPIAAPSANRFGRISPTTAGHVREELDGRIPFIVDGGPTLHGIESTIIALHGKQMEVLRRGPVTSEQLANFGQITIAGQDAAIRAPGQLPSHYAPRTPLVLVRHARSFVRQNQRCGLLAWHAVGSSEDFAEVRTLSAKSDLREAATNLFHCLRELDQLDLDLIVAEELPEEGLGGAIMDRLRRAAAGTRQS